MLAGGSLHTQVASAQQNLTAFPVCAAVCPAVPLSAAAVLLPVEQLSLMSHTEYKEQREEEE